MRSTFAPLLMLLGISCLASLSDRSISPVPVSGGTRAVGDLLPLAVGNYWSYRIVEGRRFSDSVTYGVVGTRKIPCGREVFLFDSRWLLGKDAAYLRDGALYGLEMGRASYSREMLVPAQAEPGRTWEADRGAHFTLVDGDDTVKVPAGTFVCSRIDVTRPRPEHLAQFTMWWAPGVGLVKVGGESLTMELLAYDVG